MASCRLGEWEGAKFCRRLRSGGSTWRCSRNAIVPSRMPAPALMRAWKRVSWRATPRRFEESRAMVRPTPTPLPYIIKAASGSVSRPPSWRAMATTAIAEDD